MAQDKFSIVGSSREGRAIYLDSQATTPLDPRVLDAMLPYMTQLYGNPHSRTHAYGWEAADVVEEGRAKVAHPNPNPNPNPNPDPNPKQPPIGMTTAIDTGDWKNIHPPDKQVRVRGGDPYPDPKLGLGWEPEP